LDADKNRYNDDEPAAKPAPAPEPEQPLAAQSAAPEVHDEHGGDTGQYQDYSAGDNTQMKYEEEGDEDDDDDIDFNLGNGPSTTVTQHDHHEEKPSYSAAPAPAPPVKGPNAKEDG
jgi:hypothetical protein